MSKARRSPGVYSARSSPFLIGVIPGRLRRTSARRRPEGNFITGAGGPVGCSPALGGEARASALAAYPRGVLIGF